MGSVAEMETHDSEYMIFHFIMTGKVDESFRDKYLLFESAAE